MPVSMNQSRDFAQSCLWEADAIDSHIASGASRLAGNEIKTSRLLRQLAEFLMSKVDETEPSIDETLTPQQWADVALASAQIKRTKRKFFAPHIARAITEAQAAAVKKALRG